MTDRIGKWVRLENVIASPKANARGGASKAGHQKHRKRGYRGSSSWVVLVPGVPEKGERIRVASVGGRVSTRWVQSMVRSALDRGDGLSVVAVSNMPVERDTEAPMDAAAPPRPPPPLKQRNPRVCEGPCRPGAGMCDGCKTG